MTEPLYSVSIALGDGADYGLGVWTLDHQPAVDGAPAKVTDGVRVLDGVRFAWSHPDSPLWPLQPNAMTAALALTVPDFDDEPWMEEGAPVAIVVDVLGVEKFRFAGRLTDGTAVGRTGRTGVTLSIVAVDYTVDPGEWTEVAAIPNGGVDRVLLTNLWAVTDLGDFPTWPTPDSNVAGLNVGDVRGTIDDVLLTTCHGTYDTPPDPPVEWAADSSPVRTIFAPQIDPATGRPPTTGPRWAFDHVWNNAPAPRLTIDASRIDKGALTWARNKRTQPSILTVIGGTPTGDSEPVGTLADFAPFAVRKWGVDVGNKLDTVTIDITRVAEILYYYLPTQPDRGWALPAVRWHLTRNRTDDEVAALLVALPDTLFPRWDLPEGDPDRAAYCQRLVELTGIATDLNPYSADPYPNIVAPLAGCVLTIQRGHIVLDLTLRHLHGAPS